MFEIPGYQNVKQIHEGLYSVVCRAQREEGNISVFLKILKNDYPAPEEISRLQREFEITQKVAMDGVVRAYGLHFHGNICFLVLGDIGGKTLATILAEKKESNLFLTMEEFLPLALRITDILHRVHQADIIHKNINPANWVWNPENDIIQLIDFGCATEHVREVVSFADLNVQESNLAYISPEQTGRINREVDYRTDFYSLGATFYCMLTGQSPFFSPDPMEMVHCHIVKDPPLPQTINPVIPVVLSKIVMKLLAKAAEDRYQSLLSLKEDLNHCQKQLSSQGKIADFTIAGYDISPCFKIPEKLYGRSQEIEMLINSFENSVNSSQLVLVSGYSGVGKSAVVRAVRKPIREKRGAFIEGKFDQFKQNLPYTAIISAFQQLARYFLRQSEHSLARWRETLQKALGNNGQVVIDVLPELELIIGKQPVVAEVGAEENRNRFRFVFQRFVAALASFGYPLVLFLDDLQWADTPSLELIKHILLDRSIQGLLIVGAYRDNEVKTGHSLLHMLEELKQLQIFVESINLSPLKKDDVDQLLRETLRRKPGKVEKLVDLCLAKTGGNPFYLRRFLQSLAEDGLIFMKPETGYWQWDTSQIQEQTASENIVDFMIRQINKLPQSSLQLLAYASLLGGSFSLNLLARFYQEKASVVSEKMDILLLSQFLSYVNEGYEEGYEKKYKVVEKSADQIDVVYRFAHDRVQQAAYSRLDDQELPQLHLKVGRLLQAQAEAEGEHLLEIVNHLNQASSLLIEPGQRQELIRLNLQAGQKTQLASAYQPSLVYLDQGIKLLAADSWQCDYRVSLALYQMAARSALFIGDLRLMDRYIDEALKNISATVDKVTFYEIKISALNGIHEYYESIRIAFDALNMLDVKLPRSPGKLTVALFLFKLKYRLRKSAIASLSDLPRMTDPKALAALNIMSSLSQPAHMTNPNLFAILGLKNVELTLKYGIAPESSIGFILYSIIISSRLNEIKQAEEIGRIALALNDKFGFRKTETQSRFLYYHGVTHWRAPHAQTKAHLLDVYNRWVETGDLEFGTGAYVLTAMYTFMKCRSLVSASHEIETMLHKVESLNQRAYILYLKTTFPVIQNLLEYAELPDIILNESTIYEDFTSANDPNGIAFLMTYKALLACLFNQYQRGVEYIDRIPNPASMTGSPTFALQHFYDAVNRLEAASLSTGSARRKLIRQAGRRIKNLKRWAEVAPRNYLHKWYLVEAERLKVAGKIEQAEKHYMQAIEIAGTNDFIQEEALANELAGRFYLQRELSFIASAYLQQAYYLYLRWGAKAKVQQMKNLYGSLIKVLPAASSGVLSPDTVSDKTNISLEGLSGELDLNTLLKSSRAISGEIYLDELLSKMMNIMMENAGAQRGILLFQHDGGWILEAESVVDREPVTKLEKISVETEQAKSFLPVSMIHHVIRIQESMVLSDAAADDSFMRDPYIIQKQPKSILCQPLFLHGDLTVILYLENQQTADVFTKDRLQVLQILSSQAAISIENAQFYASIEEKVKQRTEELAEKTEELAIKNEELHILSITDRLTGIFNRAKLDDQIKNEINRVQRFKTSFGVIILDIDHFKKVNDTYGHQVGDQVLVEFADILGSSVRDTDFVGRWGGEEFLLICPGTDQNGILKLAETLRVIIEKHEFPVVGSKTASFGVAVCRAEDTPKSIIARADKALYSAKESGRNQVGISNEQHAAMGNRLDCS